MRTPNNITLIKAGMFFISVTIYLFIRQPVITTINIEKLSTGIVVTDNDNNRTEIGHSPKKITSIAVSFIDNNNLPKPEPFVPQLGKVEVFDQDGKLTTSSNSPVQNLGQTEISKILITTKNTLFTEIKLIENSDSYYLITYRPVRERNLQVEHFEAGKETERSNNWRLFKYSYWHLIHYYTKIIFQAFPLLVGIYFTVAIGKKIKGKITGLAGSKFLDLLIRRRKKTLLIRWCSQDHGNILLGMILAVGLGYLIWVNVVYVEQIPHSPDSTLYLWAAKYLASGKLWLSPPLESFDFLWHHYLPNNHWVIVWPYGQPLMLMVGVLLGIPWLVPIVVGVLFLILMFFLLKRSFGLFVSLAAIVVTFYSPLFQIHATTYMTHNTAVFLMAAFWISLLWAFKKGTSLKLIIPPLLLSWLYLTRPMTAPVALITGLVLLLTTITWRKMTKRKLVLFAGFGLFFLLLILMANKTIYGDIIKTPYNLLSVSKTIWGGSGYGLDHGLTDGLSNLLYLRIMYFPATPLLFSLILITSLLSSSRGILLFSWLGIILTVFLTATYDDVFGLFYGPRFWYEILPFLMVLTGISLNWFINMFGKKSGYLFTFILLIYVAHRSIVGWTIGEKPILSNLIYFTPNTVKELKGINYTDARLIKKAKTMQLQNALIFVKEGSGWWCYGSVLSQNTVNFDGNIVWAQDLGDEKNQLLIQNYPERSFYFADYDLNNITPLVTNQN